MSEYKPQQRPVPPGGTIGIIGGGQLGRMLALAAPRLGLKTSIYSDTANAPALDVSSHATVGSYEDLETLGRFAKNCAVVTFEFENLPAHAIAHLSEMVPVCPGAHALSVTQDRLSEKAFVHRLGFKTAPFFEVSSAVNAREAFDRCAGTAILKTRRFGYDGKGQSRVTSADEAERAFDASGQAPSILESFVEFAFEASIVAARATDGSFAAYDPAENVHENHILRRSSVPSRLTLNQIEQAKAIASRLADELDYVGVFAIEFFVTQDGELLVNEIAPRVHNSGHWTIEACICSQFEQHIRAVAGWPLGSSARHSDAVMENIIGAEADAWLSLSKNGALHLYGKSQTRPGRKMGHVTRLKTP